MRNITKLKIQMETVQMETRHQVNVKRLKQEMRDLEKQYDNTGVFIE